MAKNLKIDTSFLNEEENTNDYKKNDTTNSSNYYKNKNNKKSNDGFNWSWLWIIFIIFIFIWIFSDDDSSNTSPSSSSNYNSNSNSNSDNDIIMEIWEYSCYSSAYYKALSLQPDENAYQIKADELDRLESAYKNFPLNKYSQSSVDNYNSKIDSFNKKLAEHEPIRLDYNRKVDIYNNYLDNNCTKRY
jgi:hypothetical protein